MNGQDKGYVKNIYHINMSSRINEYDQIFNTLLYELPNNECDEMLNTYT